MMLVCMHHPGWGVNRSNRFHWKRGRKHRLKVQPPHTRTHTYKSINLVIRLTSRFKGWHDWLRVPTLGHRQRDGSEMWTHRKGKQKHHIKENSWNITDTLYTNCEQRIVCIYMCSTNTTYTEQRTVMLHTALHTRMHASTPTHVQVVKTTNGCWVHMGLCVFVYLSAMSKKR